MDLVEDDEDMRMTERWQPTNTWNTTSSASQSVTFCSR